MDIRACMQHQGWATRTLIKVDISTRRHIGYAIIAKCSASAQAISGAHRLRPGQKCSGTLSWIRGGLHDAHSDDASLCSAFLTTAPDLI